MKIMMRDEMNIRDNAFFFCGRHAKGFEKIKYAMWKVDPVHGSSFSVHRQLPASRIQSDMFETVPQTDALSVLIRNRYAGQKGISVGAIFQWTIEETDSFLPTHARIELESLLRKGFIERIVDPKATERKRVLKTWPQRLMLDFAM